MPPRAPRPRRRRSSARPPSSSARARCASARASSSTIAPSRPRPTLRRDRRRGRHGQLEPRDRVHRLRRVHAPVLRAARCRERARGRGAETPDGEAPLPALVQFGGQTPLNLASHLAAAGVDLPGIDDRGHRPHRGPDALRVDGRATRHPAAGRRHRGLARGGASRSPTGSAIPSSSAPRSSSAGSRSTSATAPPTWRGSSLAATVVSEERPVRIDAFLEGLEVDVDGITDGTRRPHPGPDGARRAGGHPLG